MAMLCLPLPHHSREFLARSGINAAGGLDFLTLNKYAGQAAYISDDRSAYSNPFYNTVAPGMFYPSLVLAILAAVIASQTMITATFQVRINPLPPLLAITVLIRM